jgi:tRNA 5-methylaminomethyl-2-thiouridine biosynthesis bifunctional protein
MPLTPARIAFLGDGTPYSVEYGDVYHSAQGGLAQSRHVFLGGNDLPSRWAGRRLFTVVETGFGLGVNFLATRQAWRDDPRRCERLHYVAVDKHPVGRADLQRCSGGSVELADCAAGLCAEWPEPVAGWHRLHFELGRVTLTLVFGDVAEVLPQLRCQADAFYLDGFAPDRNTGMWSVEVLRQCARLAAADATLATYTAARVVRDNLLAAGFAVARQPGYANKRHMLTARPSTGTAVAPAAAAAARAAVRRHALVVGCGIAGAAVAERIAARGWRVTVVDGEAGPASGASGLHAGAIHPHLSRDDSVLARLTRAGFFHARSNWRRLQEAGHDPGWTPCGVARPARSAAEEAAMAGIVATCGYPREFVEVLDRDALAARCGQAVAHGGYWFPGGGIVRPARVVDAQLTQAQAVLAFGRRVESLRHDGGEWHATAGDGALIASAPVVVLANAGAAIRLAPAGCALRPVRGQLTYLPAAAAPALTSAVVGDGYVLPAVDGVTVVGGTYDRDSVDLAARPGDHRANLATLRRLVPDSVAVDAPDSMQGFVGLRAVALDRLPLIGAMPDVEAGVASGRRICAARLHEFPRVAGLYGAFGYASRGLTWAALGGEIIASLLDGEPAPVAGQLLDAVDPARFVFKAIRRDPANASGAIGAGPPVR